jgi:hypothetical protein
MIITDEEILSLGPREETREWPYEAQVYFARKIEKVILERLGYLYKTKDGVVVKPGDKVWVLGSYLIEQTTVKKFEPITNYIYFDNIPVSESYSTYKDALQALKKG